MWTRALQGLLPAGMAVLALTACTTTQVSSDINTRDSISNCHTYAWLSNAPNQRGAFTNPVNQDRLRAAIDANLQGKGLTLAAKPELADCMVGEAIGTRTVVEDDPYGFGWGVGWGWRRRGYIGGGWGGGWDYPYAYSEGRIAIDLFNAKTHQPIWHASVNANVGDLTGSAADAKINAAAAALFTKYPGA